MRRRRALAILLALALGGAGALAGGCSAILGFERPGLEATDAGGDEGRLGETGGGGADGPVVSGSCSSTAPCSDARSCLFGTCAVRCLSDAECHAGERCLHTNAGNGCVSDTAGDCAIASSGCPEGTRCMEDGRCRTKCTAADAPGASCTTDQACVNDVCRGRLAEHDPGALVRPGETWLVAVPVGPSFSTYVTDRDCRNPARICVGCAPLSISPSGKTALVALGVPEAFGWVLSFVRLDADRPLAVAPSKDRPLPSACDGVLLDDELVAYRRAPSACDTGTSIARWSTVTNETLTLATGLGKGLGAVVARTAQGPLAVASTRDGGAELRILALDGGTLGMRTLDAPADGLSIAPFGARDDGLLAQVELASSSRIDRLDWANGATMSSPYPNLGTEIASRFGCARIRHLPASGEFICVTGSGGTKLFRLGLDGRSPAPLECTIGGVSASVVDVRAP
ncbi:MAG: hypothetical protein U0270_29925 [Labilithrix sp.]